MYKCYTMYTECYKTVSGQGRIPLLSRTPEHNGKKYPYHPNARVSYFKVDQTNNPFQNDSILVI